MLAACRLAGLSALEGPMRASNGAQIEGRHYAPQVDSSTRKWRSIAPLPIMPKPAAKVQSRSRHRRCNSVHKGNNFYRRPPTQGGKNGGYAYVYDCTIIFRERLERIV